jgi:hypothetical protein
LAACLASSAFADIKAFNAAVQAGDYKAAAAEAKATWPGFNKTSASTAAVAREFGYASYMAGDYAAARAFGQYVKDNAASLPKPDDLPRTTSVMLAASTFRLGPTPETRKALYDAVANFQPDDALDNMFIAAAELLYESDLASGAWRRTVESARLAEKLLVAGGKEVEHRALEARAVAAAASFVDYPTRKDYDILVDTHDAVVDAMDGAEGQPRRKPLAVLKYQVQAWVMAVEQYYAAARQTGTRLKQDVKVRQLKAPRTAPFPDLMRGVDSCRGDLRMHVQYPPSAEFSGMVGAIILKNEYAADGAVVRTELLGAVPSRSFSAAVLQALPSARLTRAGGDAPSCDLSGVRLLEVVFQIYGG